MDPTDTTGERGGSLREHFFGLIFVAMASLLVQSFLSLKDLSIGLGYALGTIQCFITLGTFSLIVWKYVVRGQKMGKLSRTLCIYHVLVNGELKWHGPSAAEITSAVYTLLHLIINIMNVIFTQRPITSLLAIAITLASVTLINVFVDFFVWFYWG